LAQEIYEKEGIKGFWRGFFINAVLVSNPAITFYVYGRLRKNAHKLGYKSPLVDFFCGFLAKMISTLITYPAMLLKTRLVLDEEPVREGDLESGKDTMSDGNVKTVSPSVLQICEEVLTKRGIIGFYDGISAKMLQTTLTQAFTFMCKEELVKHTLSLFVFFFALRHVKNAPTVALK